MYFSAACIKAVIKLVTQRIGEGQYSRLSFNANAGSGAVRAVFNVLVVAVVFVPGAFGKYKQVGILSKNKTVFHGGNNVSTRKNALFIKATQGL